MPSSRDRLTILPLDGDPAMRLALSTMPPGVRSRALAVVSRGRDTGWLCRSPAGLWAMLTLSGGMSTLPQHKVGPALEAAGIHVAG